MGEKLSSRQTTAITTGTYFHIIIPSGTSYLSKKIPFEVIKDAVNLSNSPNKGYYEDEAALIAAFPVGEAGWYAINGDTDTVWIWDTTTGAWIDTTNSGLVTSVNGLTGAVVLAATNIGFTSLEGIPESFVDTALDYLKVRIEEVASGAGGVNIYNTRHGVETLSPGLQTITFEQGGSPSPLADDDYTLIPTNLNGGNIDLVNITQSASGFQVQVNSETVLHYLAVKNTATTGAFTDTSAIHIDVSGEIDGLAEKVAIVDNDLIIIEDSEDSFSKKKVKKSNFTTVLPSSYNDTFTSGDLVSGVLSVNHNLTKKYITSLVIYDNNDILVNHTNYDYTAIDQDNGEIELYLPITGTWTYIIS